MKKTISGTATEPIEAGAYVLIRNRQCCVASPDIANAIAKPSRYMSNDGNYKKGEWVYASAIQGQGERNLQAMADAGLMSALHIYLPAGTITEEQYQMRLDQQFRDAGIDKN